MRVPFIPYVQGRNDYTDRDGRKYGIAIHNTSNDASDTGEASYATRRTDGVSAHLYADIDSVTQSIDTDDKTGHAGSPEGNENAISIEFVGGNGKSREWWLANIAWGLVGRVIAYLVKNDPDLAGFQVRRASVAEMKANPQVKAFYGHDDMRQAWGGTTHTDPGPGFPWDKLFAVVNAALNPEDEMKLFRVKGTNPVYLYDGRGRRHIPDQATKVRVQKALGLGPEMILETQADLDLVAPLPLVGSPVDFDEVAFAAALEPRLKVGATVDEIAALMRSAINGTRLVAPEVVG